MKYLNKKWTPQAYIMSSVDLVLMYVCVFVGGGGEWILMSLFVVCNKISVQVQFVFGKDKIFHIWQEKDRCEWEILRLPQFEIHYLAWDQHALPTNLSFLIRGLTGYSQHEMSRWHRAALFLNPTKMEHNFPYMLYTVQTSEFSRKLKRKKNFNVTVRDVVGKFCWLLFLFFFFFSLK